MKKIAIICSTSSGGAYDVSKRISDALRDIGDWDVELITPRMNNFGPLLKLCFKYETLLITYIAKIFRRIATKHDYYFFDLPLASLILSLWTIANKNEYSTFIVTWRSHFMSLRLLKYLVKSNKNVVFFNTDFNFFTGGCHFNNGCMNHKMGCKSCPAVPKLLEPWIVKRYRSKVEIASSTVSLIPSKELMRHFEFSDLKYRQSANIYFPVDTVYCPPKINLIKNRTRIVFLSTSIADPRKGLDIFVEALRSVRLQKNATDFIFTFIGGGSTTNAKISELSKYYKIETFDFLDSSKLNEVYSQARVFVNVPSQDLIPMAVVEAISAGCPIITSKVGVGPELADLGCGWVLENYNAHTLETKLRNVLVMDEGTYSSYLQACNKSHALFSAKAFCNNIREHIM